MLKKLLIGVAGLLVLLFLTVAAALVVTNPEQPAADSRSAQWLQPGPYEVSTTDLVFVDDNRPTPANREFTGAPARTFNTTLWYPEQAQGEFDKLVLRCQYKFAELNFKADTDYQIPDSWGACQLQVTGTAGASAQMIQFQKGDGA